MNNQVSGPNDWAPLSPVEAGRVFAGFPGLWAIAGGWAIDLFIGQQTRPHADIDIVIDRRVAARLHHALPGWELFLAHRFVCRWAEASPVPAEVSDIWCRRPEGPWQFQVMLGDFDEGSWFYRRNHAIHGPIFSLTVERAGLPIVAPEIQLLYKSTRANLAKNQHDFSQVLPLLDDQRRSWLADALGRTNPDHPWLVTLGTA